MGIKTSNEITVKLKCSIEETRKLLLEKGFVEQYNFSLTDNFFVPKDLNMETMSIREILANAVLTRYIVRNHDPKQIEQRMTFKKKEIDENGVILSQEATSCDVENIEDAKRFLEVIGYKQIMEITEYDVAYKKDSFFVETKDIVNGDNLMEVETLESGPYSTIEGLKARILEEGIPIYTDNFFVKKAEVELGKVLRRK